MLPRKPSPTGKATDRWIVAGFALVIFGGFGFDLLANERPAWIVVPLVLVAYAPLLALHEAGHALAAATLGWRVVKVVIGFGRTILRFRVRSVPVDIRLLPVSGYVVPAPRSLDGARWRSVIIYAAGPAATLLVLAAVVAATGTDHLLSRSDRWPLLLAQSVALAAVLHTLPNLVPLPTDDGVTDGFGLLASLFRSEGSFEGQLAAGYAVAAEELLRRGDPAGAVSVYERAVAAHPHNVPLQLSLAASLVEAGRPAEAGRIVEPLLDDDALPNHWRAEVRNLVAKACVDLGREDLLAVADEQSLACLELAPHEPRYQITRGAVLLARGLLQPGLRLLRAARGALSPDDLRLDECDCYLAVGEKQQGNQAEAEHILEQLRARGARGELLDRTAREVADVAGSCGAGGTGNP